MKQTSKKHTILLPQVKRPNSFSPWLAAAFIVVFGLIGAYIIWRAFGITSPEGDLNNDGIVNVTDLSILLTHFGTSYSPADINGDGTVSILDLSILLSHYGQNTPVVAITAPAANATVSGTVTVTADVSDASGLAKVEFYENNRLIGTDTASPYTLSWDTSSLAAGIYQLTVKATGTDNNISYSAAVPVTVGKTGTGYVAPYAANIEFPGGGYGAYQTTLLNDPAIGGVDINMDWNAVEPSEGNINFGPLDNTLAAWAKAGKKAVLIIRGVTQDGAHVCSNGQYTPAWELAKVPNFCDSDLGTVIPDYFNATFQSDWKAYVDAIGAHVEQSPYRQHIAYIRAGVGLAGEGFYLTYSQNDFNTDLSKLKAWGWSPTVWRDWQREMMLNYQTAFPHEKVIYPVVKLDPDPTDNNMLVDVENAEWATPGQNFGIGQQGLVPTMPTSTWGDEDKIWAYIKNSAPNTYVQFQTGSGVSSLSIVQGDINASETIQGVKSIEWYDATLSNIGAYRSAMNNWQQYVNNKYGNQTTL